MEQKSVTIVIPVFNGAAFLAAAIDSVLAQDYPNLECLVIDDGSTDDTPEVIAGYGSRIASIRQDNAGIAGAVNRGFEEAVGDLVGVLNSDDLLYPDAVRVASEAFASARSASAVHGVVQLTTVTNEPLFKYAIGDVTVRDCLRHHTSPSTTGVLYPRELALELGGWSGKYHYGPDFHFWLLLGLRADYVFVDHVLGTFRQHPGSRTASSTRAENAAALAREYVALTEDFLSRPDLPRWVDEIAAEARRTAYYCAGVIAGGTPNLPGERFEIKDNVAGLQVRDFVAGLASH